MIGPNVRTDTHPDAEEAMTLGHLGGWRVRKVPLTATEISTNGVTTFDAPGFATVRSNPFTGQAEALGVVGDAYTPLQNEDHADFLNTLADQSGAIFDTAGSLSGGRQVFITMKLPETLTVDLSLLVLCFRLAPLIKVRLPVALILRHGDRLCEGHGTMCVT